MKIAVANFDDVAVGFEPIVSGDYEAKCTACEAKVGKPSVANPEGFKYIGWEFTIAGPNFIGRKLFDNTGYVSEKALPFLKEMVVGCGVEFDNTGFSTEDCLGKDVNLVIGQQMNDRQQIENTIDKITPA